MNSGTIIGTGKEKMKVMLIEVLRLDGIDELLRPSQLRKALLAAREGIV
jgi:hypothetical protein